MTATCHVLHAGDGYTYLTRQVASADQQLSRGQNLADYYAAEGYPPGRWMGSGCAALEVSGQVEEHQMRALFGEGLHPDATRRIDDRLAEYGAELIEADAPGEQIEWELKRAYPRFEKEVSLGKKYAQYDPARAEEWSMAIREQMNSIATRDGVTVKNLSRDQRREARYDAGLLLFAAEKGRPPDDIDELKAYIARRSKPTPQAVAGYDMVFSPTKSVSVLWALADDDTRLTIQEAHAAAVMRAMDFVEREAIYTRTGTAGVAQVDARGIVATAFDHWDSRTGDPDLHTHVAIANKVQGPDGKWRSIDGRVLLKGVVSASETYNSAVEDELRTRLGVTFVDRASRSGRRSIREVAGVDGALIDGFSSRRKGIEQRYDELVAQYRTEHGHEPSRTTQYRLAQQATLDTRDAKDAPESLGDKRDRWRETAQSLIGQRRVTNLLADCRAIAGADREHESALEYPGTAGRVRSDVASVDVEQVALRTVEVVQHERSTWQVWHLRAEAHRQLRAFELESTERDQVVQEVLDQARSRCVLVTPPVPEDVVDDLQRNDGSSVFRVHGADLYTSQDVLDAEDRLLAAAQTPARAPVEPPVVEAAIAYTDSRSRHAMDPGQRRLVESFASSERLLVVGVGPAGTGKTTAMKGFADACRANGRRILGLAPSAAAASVLQEDIEFPAETLAKILFDLDAGADVDIRPGDVLLVDEAGMSATDDLDRITHLAEQRGAVVRLLGDPQQLSAVGAGGALRLLVNRTDAVILDQIHRFRDPAEADATLKLREGDLSAIDFYSDSGRLHSGSVASLQDRLYRDWLDDVRGGHNSIMVAADNNSARALAERARLDRVADGVVETGGVDLHDGTKAGRGDIIVTRKNRRSLRLGTNDFVKNRDLWAVRRRHSDGALTVAHKVTGRKTTLPPDYVSEHVELGYAFTGHQVQGITVDVARALVDSAMVGRDWLYVALTRGSHRNDVYLATDDILSVDADHAPDRPLNPREAFSRVLATEPEGISAHGAIEHEQDAHSSLAMLVPQYEHAYGLVAGEAHQQAVRDAFSLPAATVDKPHTPATVDLAPDLDPEVANRLYAVNVAAHRFFLASRDDAWVPAELERRGLLGDDIGYAPAGVGTATVDYLRAHGFTNEELLDAGIAKTNARGRLYDTFRDRLTIPIRDPDGHIVGFSGRRHPDLSDDDRAGPKYLNTAESPIFKKRNVLSGLFEGADQLRDGAVAVICEGPLDRLAITEASQGHAVGLDPGGTALTPEQIASLGTVVDITDHPIVDGRDNDTAGERAAANAWPLLTDAGIDNAQLGRAHYNGHKDPNDLLLTDGPTALRDAVTHPDASLLDTHIDSIVHRWDQVLDSIGGQHGMLHEAARSLHHLDDTAVVAAMARIPQRHPEAGLDPLLIAEITAAVRAERDRTTSAAEQAQAAQDQPTVTYPGYAERVLADTAWPALAARLEAVDRRGADPTDVLRSVIVERELDTANSAAEALCWRLDQAGYTPADLHTSRPDAIDTSTPLGRWIHDRHDTIRQRSEQTTRALLDEQPDWLVDTLGPPPGTRDDAYWNAAQAIATYRDRYELTDSTRPLGHRPSATRQREEFRSANRAIANWRNSIEPELDEPWNVEQSRMERQALTSRLDSVLDRLERGSNTGPSQSRRGDDPSDGWDTPGRDVGPTR